VGVERRGGPLPTWSGLSMSADSSSEKIGPWAFDPQRAHYRTHQLRSGHGCPRAEEVSSTSGLTSGAGGLSEQRRQSAAEWRRRCFVWSGHGGGKCKRHVPECRPRDRGHQRRQVNGERLGRTTWLDGWVEGRFGGAAPRSGRSAQAGAQARAAEMK
jgi:hypothetical protein